MKSISNKLRCQRGVWTMEIVGSMVMLGIVANATCGLLSNGSRTFSRESLNARLQGDLTAAQSVFLEDAQAAGYSPDGTAGALGTFQAVTTGTTADRVEFIADVDSNHVSDLVVYEVVDGKLLRSIYPWGPGGWEMRPAETLAGNVKSFTLTFLDENRAPLTAARVKAEGTEAARTLKMAMSLGGSAKGGPVAQTLFGEISFRN